MLKRLCHRHKKVCVTWFQFSRKYARIIKITYCHQFACVFFYSYVHSCVCFYFGFHLKYFPCLSHCYHFNIKNDCIKMLSKRMWNFELQRKHLWMHQSADSQQWHSVAHICQRKFNLNKSVYLCVYFGGIWCVWCSHVKRYHKKIQQ